MVFVFFYICSTPYLRIESSTAACQRRGRKLDSENTLPFVAVLPEDLKALWAADMPDENLTKCPSEGQ